MPSRVGTITVGSEKGLIFGPAFWWRRTTFELVRGIAKSGRGSKITVQCHQLFARCSWMTSSAQLLLVLNTCLISKIKLKLATCVLGNCSSNCGGHLSRTPSYAEFLDPNQGTRSISLGTWQACFCGVVALAFAFALGMALQETLKKIETRRS